MLPPIQLANLQSSQTTREHPPDEQFGPVQVSEFESRPGPPRIQHVGFPEVQELPGDDRLSERLRGDHISGHEAVHHRRHPHPPGLHQHQEEFLRTVRGGFHADGGLLALADRDQFQTGPSPVHADYSALVSASAGGRHQR